MKLLKELLLTHFSQLPFVISTDKLTVWLNQIGIIMFKHVYMFIVYAVCGGGGIIWSPADLVNCPTDIEMISL